MEKESGCPLLVLVDLDQWVFYVLALPCKRVGKRVHFLYGLSIRQQLTTHRTHRPDEDHGDISMLDEVLNCFVEVAITCDQKECSPLTVSIGTHQVKRQPDIDGFSNG